MDEPLKVAGLTTAPTPATRTNYIYIYILYKNNIDHILFLDCNPEDLTCSCLMNSSIGADFKNLFLKYISDEKFNQIKKKKMVKLARYSRDVIKNLKNRIK